MNLFLVLLQIICFLLFKNFTSFELPLFEVISEFHSIIKSLLHDFFFFMHGNLLLLCSLLFMFALNGLFDKFGVIVAILFV